MKKGNITITLLLLIIALFVSFHYFNKAPLENNEISLDCVTKIEQRTANGYSLSGLIEDGEEVLIYHNYYACNEVSRDDLVIYYYAGSSNPLIKIVKGVPNDTFDISGTENSWNILVNNEILTNSEGIPYLINNQRKTMLSLYIDNYNKVIPPNTYLLLGNQKHGSTDSTKFGLIDISTIMGKGEMIKNVDKTF